jgi:hypothetical protein
MTIKFLIKWFTLVFEILVQYICMHVISLGYAMWLNIVPTSSFDLLPHVELDKNELNMWGMHTFTCQIQGIDAHYLLKCMRCIVSIQVVYSIQSKAQLIP